MRLAFVAALACAAALTLASAAGAQPMVALTTSNEIFTFDSTSPDAPSFPVAVTGLGTDVLYAIDRNPIDGQLYGLARQSRMYRISPTRVATQVGPTFATPLTGTSADMDFDPADGTARITTDSDQNLLWSPSDGLVQDQTALAYASGDAKFGQNPTLIGLAYSHNVPGAPDARIFGYDYSIDNIVTLGSPVDNPSNGKLHTLAASAVVGQGQRVGLDAAPDGTMFALLRAGLLTQLFTIDQQNGAMSVLGAVGNGGDTVQDIATEAVTNNIKLSAASYDVGESDRTVDITVTRSQTLGSATARLTTSDGSATTGHDYSGAVVPIPFADGQASVTVKLRIRSDLLDEPATEAFGVTLGDPEGGHAAVVSPSTAIVQIHDDDTGPPPSTPVTALPSSNQLVRFDSATPETLAGAPLAITGLPVGEVLVAIDRRPATGRLYAMGAQSRLYTIDETTGAATEVGAQFSPLLGGASWGFDFDPHADRIRVASNSGQNLRIAPDTAAVSVDTPLVYAPGDPALPAATDVLGLAYANDVPGAPSTTLFGYDFLKDSIVRIGSPGGAPSSPNDGLSFTIGKSAVASHNADAVGMDIAPDGRAWALLRDSNHTRLNLVDLQTGLTSLTGDIGDGSDVIRDIALAPVSNAIRFRSARFRGSEPSRKATIVVTRGQSRGAAIVSFKTSDGTAKAGADYTPESGTLVFAAGQRARAITVPVIDDSAREALETFKVTLTGPKGGAASLASPSTALVTIADDDGPPVLRSCHRARQRLLKQKAVVVCVRSSKDGSARATGKLKVKGIAKPFKLRKARRTVVRFRRTKLRLKLSRRARAALAKHRRATATVKLRVRDRLGHERRLTLKVRAKRR